ncbi:MAG: hypothetical protein GY926_01400, partial [bacterium]|nr:hypothetical protein [bacterium]
MTRNLADSTPEQLIAEIGKLREESKGHRLRASQYEQVFSRFTPEDQRGLLHVVSVFADDRTAGAGLFQQLAESVTGPGPGPSETTVEQEPIMT